MENKKSPYRFRSVRRIFHNVLDIDTKNFVESQLGHGRVSGDHEPETRHCFVVVNRVFSSGKRVEGLSFKFAQTVNKNV